jgi:formate dehydrogenase major subunit
VPGLGTRLGRGGATTFEQDLTNSDCIVVMGSNMAENHPVAFRFALKARERGARLIHVDPRFSRTSALADTYVRIRSGTDIVFLGGLINYTIQNELYFKEYVQAYTNAAVLIDEQFKDTEDLDGLFSGFDAKLKQYDTKTWQYRGNEASGTKKNTVPEHESETAGQVSQGGGQASKHGAGGAGDSGNPADPPTDPTLQDPLCVFQIVKRHFARYTPEMVAELCGCSAEDFLAVAKAIT